jgi:hypothetical protein
MIRSWKPPPLEINELDLVTFGSPKLENLELDSLKEEADKIEELFKKTNLKRCDALKVRVFFAEVTKAETLKNWWALPTISKAFQIMNSPSRIHAFITALELNRHTPDCKINTAYLLETDARTQGLNPFQNILPQFIRKALTIESKFKQSNSLVTGMKCDRQFKKLIQKANKKIDFRVRSGGKVI